MSGNEIVTTEGLKCLLKRQFEGLQDEVKEAQVACNDLGSQSVYIDDCEIEDAIEVETTVNTNTLYATDIQMPDLKKIHERIDTLGRLISQIEICEDHGPTTVITYDDNGGQIKNQTCEISRVWYKIDKLIDVVEMFERRMDSFITRLGPYMAERSTEIQALQTKVDQIWERTCNRTESWKPGDGQD